MLAREKSRLRLNKKKETFDILINSLKEIIDISPFEFANVLYDSNQKLLFADITFKHKKMFFDSVK